LLKTNNMLHINNTQTRIEVMTEKELREKHEHEMLKNNIRLFILLFAMMAFTYTVIVW